MKFIKCLLIALSGVSMSTAFSPSNLPPRVTPLNRLSTRHQMLPSLVAEAPQIYDYCLHTYPLETQMATAGSFHIVGDTIAQTAFGEEGKKYSPLRTFHYFLKGLGAGILWSLWYGISDDFSTSVALNLVGNDGDVARIATAIVLEQFVMCPIIYGLWELPVIALLSGSPVRSLPFQVKSKLPDLLVANAKVWTPVNVVTYSLPAEYRLLFISAIDIFWQSINSSIATRDVECPPPSTEVVSSPAPATNSGRKAVTESVR